MGMTAPPARRSYAAGDRTEPLLELAVGDLLRRAAAATPGAPALIVGAAEAGDERRWTFAQLLADAERVAWWLLARVRPGEHVAIWAPNMAEWVLVEWGAALAGVVLVAINPALGEREGGYILRHSRAALLLYAGVHRDNDLAGHVRALAPSLEHLRDAVRLERLRELVADPPSAQLPDVTPDEPAQLQYTSGTTGAPKGVLLTHRTVVNVAHLCVREGGVPEAGVFVNPLPMFHTAGCVVCTLGPASLGGVQILIEAFDPGLALALIERHRAAAIGTVPTVLLALLHHPDLAHRDLSALRVALSGGAMVPAPVVRQFEERTGAAVIVLYGQTEVGSTVCQTRPRDTPEDKAGTIGTPQPHMELKAADPAAGKPTPIGVCGELCTRGYQNMICYFADPEATARAVDAEGWLHSGDLGAMDERGYFRVTGRLKELIIRGGENVSPVEVEDVLYAHPDVHEAAVIGVPDERWGERVVAVVRCASPAPEATALAEHCAAVLARHKRPTLWFHASALPMTASGKVQKFRLVELATRGELEPLA